MIGGNVAELKRCVRSAQVDRRLGAQYVVTGTRYAAAELTPQVKRGRRGTKRGFETPRLARPVPGTPIATPQPLLPSQAMPLLDTIPGVDTRTAEVMVAERGTERGQLPSAAHAAAWAASRPKDTYLAALYHQVPGGVGASVLWWPWRMRSSSGRITC
jgi:hypothetical protein